MAQHSHPPRRVAQSPKQNTFFGGAAVLAAGILVVKLIGLFYKIPLPNTAIPRAAWRRVRSRTPSSAAPPCWRPGSWWSS